MLFTVFHRNHPTFEDNDTYDFATFPDVWTPVATVETEHVGEIFELTNSIDAAWYFENAARVTLTPEGKALLDKQGGIRSTSVGDIYVAADGKRYTVDGIGLREF